MERPSPGTIGRKVWAVLEQPDCVRSSSFYSYARSRCQGGDLSTTVQNKGGKAALYL